MQEEREDRPSGHNLDDATSSQTLSDVEKKENVSDEPPGNESSDPISPDGTANTDNSERSSKGDDAGSV
jgi:hypothetical protein